MSDAIVLKITDNAQVHMGELAFRSTHALAEALQAIRRDRPDAVVCIEADAQGLYEAVGMAVFGSARAGFSGERLRLVVGGEPAG